MDTRDVRVRRLQPGALAKILGLTGLVMGLVQAAFGLLFSGAMMAGMPSSMGLLGLMGFSSLLLTPLVTGALGYILGAVFTWAFNHVGGITLSLGTRAPAAPAGAAAPGVGEAESEGDGAVGA